MPGPIPTEAPPAEETKSVCSTRCDLRASHLPRLHCFDLLPASTSMHRIALHCTGARRHERRCVALMIPDFLPPLFPSFYFPTVIAKRKRVRTLVLRAFRLLCPLDSLFLSGGTSISSLVATSWERACIKSSCFTHFPVIYRQGGARVLPHQGGPPPRHPRHRDTAACCRDGEFQNESRIVTIFCTLS